MQTPAAAPPDLLAPPDIHTALGDEPFSSHVRVLLAARVALLAARIKAFAFQKLDRLLSSACARASLFATALGCAAWQPAGLNANTPAPRPA